MGTVDLRSTDIRLTDLPNSYAFVSGDAGSHSFTNVAFATAGSQTITATDSVNTKISATTNAVDLVPAATSKLVIQSQPSPTPPAGQAFMAQPVVKEEDQYGNVETADNATVVTAALDSGTGPLRGTTTATVSGGVATFTNLFDNRAEVITLRFTSGTLAPVISNPINVTAGPATQLIVTSQPAGPFTADQPFSLSFSAEDSLGNVVRTFDGDVTISLPNDRGFTTTVQAMNGVATFTGLAVDSSAQGQTIQATAGGLSAGTSSPITVTQQPTISAPLVVYYTHKLKKGKPAGKQTFAGYTIDYSTAMNQTSTGNHGDYLVDIFALHKKGRKKVEVPKPIGFTITSVTSTSVTLKLSGKQTFPNGGQITVIGAAGGVESTSDVPLATNEVFTISKGGQKSSTPLPQVR